MFLLVLFSVVDPDPVDSYLIGLLDPDPYYFSKIQQQYFIILNDMLPI
jgi:hypothetical protein